MATGRPQGQPPGADQSGLGPAPLSEKNIMARIWTEEDKAEMKRVRDEGPSKRDIGQRFGVGGDIVRKVLARLSAGKVDKELVDVAAPTEADFPRAVPTSRPGRPPPLRIMPKDFQN